MDVKSIEKLLKSSNQQVQGAITWQNRARLHSSTEDPKGNPAYNEILRWVRSLYPSDKFEVFQNLIRYPLPSTKLTSKCYGFFDKIFDGRNPHDEFYFTDESYDEDWKVFLADKKLKKKWRTEFMRLLKSSHNSVLVVDLPNEQESDKPEPYWYAVPMSRIKGIAYDGDEITALIYAKKDNKTKHYYYDEFTYGTFEYDGSTVKANEEDFTEHDLGYCPCTFFWDNTKEIKKDHPFYAYLGQLDYLLKYCVDNEYINMYTRYPITAMVKTDCDYQTETHFCSGGFLKDLEDGTYTSDMEGCPRCAASRIDGPGTLLEYDPPSEENNYTDLSNPISISEISKGTLEYNVEDITRREIELFNCITGITVDIMANQALNETQIKGMFESQEAALADPQSIIEKAINFIYRTMCKLRYGDAFKDCSVSLGTEHYIFSSNTVLEMYQKARTSNASSVVLDTLENLYFDTEYRNNPYMRDRYKIIADLDPFRHLQKEDMKELKADISIDLFIMKMNLTSLIDRFEREYVDIVNFGVNLDYASKIASIQKQILAYVAEYLPALTDSEGADEITELKLRLEAYGAGVRAGVMTPQEADEKAFRELLKVAPAGQAVIASWAKDEGTRRPITLQLKQQIEAPIPGTPPAPTE